MRISDWSSDVCSSDLLPHTWCSRERIDPAAPHRALVLWFSRDWAGRIVDPCVEFRAIRCLLDEADRGLAFSGGIARRAGERIRALVDRDPTARLIGLLDVLAVLARAERKARLSSPALVTEPGPFPE